MDVAIGEVSFGQVSIHFQCIAMFKVAIDVGEGEGRGSVLSFIRTFPFLKLCLDSDILFRSPGPLLVNVVVLSDVVLFLQVGYLPTNVNTHQILQKCTLSVNIVQHGKKNGIYEYCFLK